MKRTPAEWGRLLRAAGRRVFEQALYEDAGEWECVLKNKSVPGDKIVGEGATAAAALLDAHEQLEERRS